MDLNQLYFDHQLLLIRAERAVSLGARREHEVGASRIAGQIGCMQRALGAAAAPNWEALAVVEGSAPAVQLRQQQGCAW